MPQQPERDRRFSAGMQATSDLLERDWRARIRDRRSHLSSRPGSDERAADGTAGPRRPRTWEHGAVFRRSGSNTVIGQPGLRFRRTSDDGPTSLMSANAKRRRSSPIERRVGDLGRDDSARRPPIRLPDRPVFDGRHAILAMETVALGGIVKTLTHRGIDPQERFLADPVGATRGDFAGGGRRKASRLCSHATANHDPGMRHRQDFPKGLTWKARKGTSCIQANATTSAPARPLDLSASVVRRVGSGSRRSAL